MEEPMISTVVYVVMDVNEVFLNVCNTLRMEGKFSSESHMPEEIQDIEDAESLETLYDTTPKQIAKKGKFEKQESPTAVSQQLEEAKALHRHFVQKEVDAKGNQQERAASFQISERFRERLRKLETREEGVAQAFEIGLAALYEAGQILLRTQAAVREQKIERAKSGRIEQTASDLEAEKRIIEIIQKKFPDDIIISEEKSKRQEGGLVLPASERAVWYVDPLDGTRSYGSNRLNYATMLAREVGGKLQFGIIFLPAKNEVYYAAQGTGAFQNEQQIRVNNMANLRDGFLELNQSHSNKPTHRFNELSLGPPVFSRVVPVECEGIAFTTLARGNSIVHTAVTPKLWDVMPGIILVKEAGGEVTDIEGISYDPQHPAETVVASNGITHWEALKVLKNALLK